MRYFARLSPVTAYRDLRLFLSYREKHELWFGVLAVVLTSLILTGFVYDSRREPLPVKRDIQYIESWPLSRSDREIIEQQKRDLVVQEKRDAEIRAWRLARQRQFQQVDNRLDAMGF